ncbi:MAG: type II secretion system protein [Methylophilaceae bacterium]
MKQFYLNLNRKGECVSARHYPLLGLAKAVTRFKQQGFSLLELVVVIALLSIVALASTTLILDNGDLKRQQETESRWNQIHDAIISQPNLYLNGSPYVRGYVADMGRLPVGIVELISQTPMYDHDDDNATAEILIPYDDDDDAGTAEITINQPDWQTIELGYTVSTPVLPATGPIYTNELHGGWRGPYLYTAGSKLFRDGWGREGDLGLAEDSVNFGWEVDTRGEQIGEVTDFFIQSWGSDQDQDTGGSGDFTEDFPLDVNQDIVSEREWTLSDAPITFNINFSNLATLPANASNLQLKIYRYMDDGDNAATLIDDVRIISADNPVEIAGGEALITQTINPNDGTPIGRFAALMWCVDVDPATSEVTDIGIYDGRTNCSAVDVEHSPVYFTLTNNTSQVTLTWNLP